jgi:hypothetical protein
VKCGCSLYAVSVETDSFCTQCAGDVTCDCYKTVTNQMRKFRDSVEGNLIY